MINFHSCASGHPWWSVEAFQFWQSPRPIQIAIFLCYWVFGSSWPRVEIPTEISTTFVTCLSMWIAQWWQLACNVAANFLLTVFVVFYVHVHSLSCSAVQLNGRVIKFIWKGGNGEVTPPFQKKSLDLVTWSTFITRGTYVMMSFTDCDVYMRHILFPPDWKIQNAQYRIKYKASNAHAFNVNILHKCQIVGKQLWIVSCTVTNSSYLLTETHGCYTLVCATKRGKRTLNVMLISVRRALWTR
jgi:hypothetical protein